MPVDRDLVQREVDLQRDAANKGGPAAAFCHVITRGEGSFSFARRIDFGLTFIEEPFMSFGSKIDIDDVIDAGFEELGGAGSSTSGTQNIPKLPQCTGYVTDYDRDDHGNYVGAWVAVMVTYPYILGSSVAGDPVPIRHFFTFQAVAIKDLSDNDEDPSAPVSSA